VPLTGRRIPLPFSRVQRCNHWPSALRLSANLSMPAARFSAVDDLRFDLLPHPCASPALFSRRCRKERIGIRNCNVLSPADCPKSQSPGPIRPPTTARSAPSPRQLRSWIKLAYAASVLHVLLTGERTTSNGAPVCSILPRERSPGHRS